jgi:hypothetical protein
LGPFPHSSPDELQRAAGAVEQEGVTSDTKYAKTDVNYRDAGSSNTRCEKCRHFRWSGGQRGKGTCRLVNGSIDAGFVCDEFETGGNSLMDLVTGEPTT